MGNGNNTNVGCQRALTRHARARTRTPHVVVISLLVCVCIVYFSLLSAYSLLVQLTGCLKATKLTAIFTSSPVGGM